MIVQVFARGAQDMQGQCSPRRPRCARLLVRDDLSAGKRQLSAERIERHIDRGITEDSSQVLRSATEVIRSSVQTLRQLVDQFAALADFPAPNRKPEDLNRIVENTLTLFAGRLEGIDVRLHLAAQLPPVMADSEALKRAFSNLIDNAAEAMQSSLLRILTLQTGWNEAQTMA